jgi:hypothetical protein
MTRQCAICHRRCVVAPVFPVAPFLGTFAADVSEFKRRGSEAMSKAAAAITLLILTSATGCTVGIPLDANMRIAINDPKLSKYSQNGRDLDQDDMRKKLRNEVEAGVDINTADRINDVGVGFSVVGCLVSGWPITSYALDGNDPRMVGVGVSVGTAIVGAILVAMQEVYVERAAQTHNAAVDERNREKQKRDQRIAAKQAAESLPKLPEGFGFDFNVGAAAAESRCKSNGYEWKVTESGFSCSGIPTTDVPQGSSELTFADEQMQTLRISIRPGNNAGAWATAIDEVEQVVTRMYGQPKEKDYTIPSECVGSAFLGCIIDGRVNGRAVWSGKKKRSVTMAIVNTSPHPRIVVDVKRIAVKTEAQ